MLYGKPCGGVSGPYRRITAIARLLKRLRGAGSEKVDLAERARMAIAGDRAEFDPLYEAKRKESYGPGWRPAA